MKLTKKKEPESDLERRLDEIGVTIECWCGGRGEDPAYERREKPWRHFVWLCTVKYEGRSFSTPFKMGTGLVTKQGLPKKPTAADVVCSMLLDASALDQDIDAWCSEFCPERPSIYFAAQESGRKVRDLLGRKLCEELGSVEH